MKIARNPGRSILTAIHKRPVSGLVQVLAMGLLETGVWVGDVLKFTDCELRVTQPREPCYKFNAAMGFSGAADAMAQKGCCGFYLAVDQPGHISAGEPFDLVPGPRRLRITESFKAKMFKQLR